MNVLVLHNRYRVHGGEERAVDLHLDALRAASVPHRALMRDSADAGRARVATAMLRGGDDPDQVAATTRDLGADVVHAHNMQPLFGPRSLAAARAEGAKTVLHLHNFRLFCAIGVAYRFGEPCFRCHHGRTIPGLALNCRRSVPEAAVYAAGLRRQYPRVLDVVDRFVTPSRYMVGQLTRLGVPADRIEALPNYLPDEAIASESRAHAGEFALIAGRLTEEKGVQTAIEVARLAGVPLKVAGDGPLAGKLDADLVGRLTPAELADLRRRAAVVLVPSRSDESFGLSALEAMGAGVPVIATRMGALPELVGEEHCLPRDDTAAMADRLRALWTDPARRRTVGDELIARVRERYTRERFTRDLLDLYSRVQAS